MSKELESLAALGGMGVVSVHREEYYTEGAAYEAVPRSKAHVVTDAGQSPWSAYDWQAALGDAGAWYDALSECGIRTPEQLRDLFAALPGLLAAAGGAANVTDALRYVRGLEMRLLEAKGRL